MICITIHLLFRKKKSGEPFGHTSRSSREEGEKDDFEVGYSFYFIHLHFARKKNQQRILVARVYNKKKRVWDLGSPFFFPSRKETRGYKKSAFKKTFFRLHSQRFLLFFSAIKKLSPHLGFV